MAALSASAYVSAVSVTSQYQDSYQRLRISYQLSVVSANVPATRISAASEYQTSCQRLLIRRISYELSAPLYPQPESAPSAYASTSDTHALKNVIGRAKEGACYVC